MGVVLEKYLGEKTGYQQLCAAVTNDMARVKCLG